MVWVRKEKEEELAKMDHTCGFCANMLWISEGKKMQEENGNLSEEVERQRKTILKMKKRLEEVAERYEELKKRVETERGIGCEEEVRSRLENMDEKIEAERRSRREEEQKLYSDIAREVRERREECEEMEARTEVRHKGMMAREVKQQMARVERGRNLIVKGLEEGVEKVEELQDICDYIVRFRRSEAERKEGMETGEQGVRIESMVRLGPRVEGRTRPLKVVLASREEADRVLRNKHILRDREDGWSEVYVDEDLNWEDRKERVELRWKVRRMRRNGVRCYLERGVVKIRNEGGGVNTMKELEQ